MSTSTSLRPLVSVSSPYLAADLMQVSKNYSQAQQPACTQSGVNQSATPSVAPSR